MFYIVIYPSLLSQSRPSHIRATAVALIYFWTNIPLTFEVVDYYFKIKLNVKYDVEKKIGHFNKFSRNISEMMFSIGSQKNTFYVSQLSLCRKFNVNRPEIRDFRHLIT